MRLRLSMAVGGVLCVAMMLGAQVPVELAKCVGSSACKACKNCNSCKYCNEDEGDCGVKRNKPAQERERRRRR